MALTKDELKKVAGYWPDIEKSRAEARRLLKEAGAENLKFTVLNRNVDQPYTIVGTWLIDQWNKVGIEATQRVRSDRPVGSRVLAQRRFRGRYHANCQIDRQPAARRVDLLSASKAARAATAASRIRSWTKLLRRDERDRQSAEQKALMRQFEKRMLDEQAHNFQVMWWYRIIPHRSLCERLEDLAEPLPEPGPFWRVDRQG